MLTEITRRDRAQQNPLQCKQGKRTYSTGSRWVTPRTRSSIQAVYRAQLYPVRSGELSQREITQLALCSAPIVSSGNISPPRCQRTCAPSAFPRIMVPGASPYTLHNDRQRFSASEPIRTRRGFLLREAGKTVRAYTRFSKRPCTPTTAGEKKSKKDGP